MRLPVTGNCGALPGEAAEAVYAIAGSNETSKPRVIIGGSLAGDPSLDKLIRQ